MLKLLADSRLWCFAAGAAGAFLWHAYVMRGHELELAEERSKKQRVVIEYREKEAANNGANVAEYLEGLENARKENERLKRSLDDGSIKLRLCLADSTVRAVEAGNSRTLEEQARADNARLREDILHLVDEARRLDAWVESAHEWVNR